jgi:hypothetical protein
MMILRGCREGFTGQAPEEGLLRGSVRAGNLVCKVLAALFLLKVNHGHFNFKQQIIVERRYKLWFGAHTRGASFRDFGAGIEFRLAR